MQLNLYLKGTRDILVIKTGKQETQTVICQLRLLFSSFMIKYILSSKKGRVERCMECYKDILSLNENEMYYLEEKQARINKKLRSYENEIVNWISEHENKGFDITWQE